MKKINKTLYPLNADAFEKPFLPASKAISLRPY
jgi:hypothetical protein